MWVGVVVLDLPLDKEVEMEFPKCQKCNNGVLIPLSDYGQEGASVLFKAWVCINPDCGFSLRVDKGEVSYGKKIEHKHCSHYLLRRIRDETKGSARC